MSVTLITPSIPVVAQGPLARILQVNATRISGVAPLGVQFRAHFLVGDDGHFDGDFVWNFGDEGATFATFDSENILLANDRNVAWGPNVAHVFREPGTYTVTCIGFRAGLAEPVERQITVTVQDPDTVQWTKDIYVSYANDFSGVPAAGAVVKHITSRAALSSELGTISGALVRVRFRRGETYNARVSGTGYTLFRVGAFGDGAMPIVEQARADFGNTSEIVRCGSGVADVAIEGIEGRGYYNPVTGAFHTTYSRSDFFRSTNSLGFATITGCKASGMVKAAYVNGMNLILDDVDFSDWNDYGFFGAPEGLSTIGGFIRQHPDVQSLDGKSPSDPDQNYPDHGPVRVQVVGWLSFDRTSIRARGGWGTATGVASRVEQSCIRLMHYDRNNLGVRTNVWGCRFDGGFSTIAYGKQNDRQVVPNVGRARIEANTFQGSVWTGSFVGASVGGIRVCNNRMIMPDLTSIWGAQKFRNGFRIGGRGGNTALEAYQQPFEFLSNTLVNEQGEDKDPRPLAVIAGGNIDDEEDEGGGEFEPGTGELEGLVLVRDNLLVGDGVPNAGDLPDWSPLDASYRPETGSAAIEGATGPAPYRDLLGNIRPANASVGALEPADD